MIYNSEFSTNSSRAEYFSARRTTPSPFTPQWAPRKSPRAQPPHIPNQTDGSFQLASKSIKIAKTNEMRNQVKNLKVEIKHHVLKKEKFNSQKNFPRRHQIILGCCKNHQRFFTPKLPILMFYNNQKLITKCV